MTNSTSFDVFEKTIAISINFEGLGTGRKVSLDGVDVNADKDRLVLTSKILQCPEHQALQNLFSSIRVSVADTKRGLTLPTLFRRGVYLVPVGLVNEVDAMMHNFQSQLSVLVEDLINVLPMRIAQDREKLREKFDLGNYPGNPRVISAEGEPWAVELTNPEGVRDRFLIAWRYLSLTPSAQLQAVSADIYAAEVNRVQAECVQLGDEIKQTLRGAALELVGHMHDRLGLDDSGKPKVFRASMVSNLVAFLNTFEARNIMGDTELSATLGTMRDLLSGVEVDSLRTDLDFRASVAAQVGGIKATLDGLVTTQGRSVILPDDDGGDDAPVVTEAPAVVEAPAKKAAKAKAAPKAKAAKAAAKGKKVAA